MRFLVAGAVPALLLAGVAFAQQSQGVKLIRVPGKQSFARVWTEPGPSGPETNYTLSTDGKTAATVRNTNYDLLLRFGRFDPLARQPAVPAVLQANADNRLMIVQYWTQGIEDYRDALRSLGVEIHLFLANHANVVELPREAVAAVRSLPFVRAVVPFHPAFKLEEELLAAIQNRATGPIKVNLLTTRRGGQGPVGEWIEANGGTVEHVSRETYLMTVTLAAEKLPALAALNSVQWIDRWGEPGNDMDIARQLHGADHVRTQGNYQGQGVRGEVLDAGCVENHPDLQSFLVHNPNTVAAHGTCTSGITFGSGGGNAQATGCMPSGFLVIGNYDTGYAGGSRYNHSGELVNPGLAYKCVFQTNSWGNSQTTQYNAFSQELDQILFDFQKLSITQSQSNLNNQFSRPEAWAKNIIAVGGINHQNTLTMNDDFWGGASIGPAADGRIKPDLASFYDLILCTDMVGAQGYSGSNYFANFGGTSGATPITGGHLGLFYQMWSDGIFGNPTPGATVFENAPYNTTAKAFLINTATQWTFSGTTHNLTRTHQGWGHADLIRMYNRRNETFFIDETEVITELQTRAYAIDVPAGTTEFRATMVYRDPPGTTSSTLHRINNLDLIVVAPNNDVYNGNNGLLSAMTSSPGGAPNNVDTVENVILDNPQPGSWRVLVFAADVNQDSHVETGAVDVDFALVVTGVTARSSGCQTAQSLSRTATGNINTYTTTLPVSGQPVTLTCNTSGFQFATFFGVLLPGERVLDSGGTALINPDSPLVFRVGPIAGPVATTQVNLPTACGTIVFSQVKLDNGPGPFTVTNARDLIVGN